MAKMYFTCSREKKEEYGFLSLLHIKFEFMKKLINAMNERGPGLQYLRNKFPRVSDAKKTFLSPSIGKLIKDQKFDDTFSEVEKIALQPFKSSVNPFGEIIKQEIIAKYCRRRAYRAGGVELSASSA